MDPDSAPNDLGPEASAAPDQHVDQEEQDLMARAMGFSSFGSQHPNKKRRYNPAADAGGFSLPPKPPSFTGANSTALGPGPSSSSKGPNADEISLDDDADEAETAVASAPTTQVRPAGLPQRPAAPPGGFAAGGHQQQQQQQPQFQPRRGQDPPPLGNWYEGHYDPMSNANPWERIEKARGMSSVGSWLSRDSGGAAVARPSTTDAPA